MPIRPEKMKLYPGGSTRSKEWLAIREAILLRAGGRCEGLLTYNADFAGTREKRCSAWNHKRHPRTGSKVVLTIAHLDHDPGNSDPANLRALCQQCHNRYDAEHRLANARARRRRESGQGDLFADNPQCRLRGTFTQRQTKGGNNGY